MELPVERRVNAQLWAKTLRKYQTNLLNNFLETQRKISL